MTDGQKLRQILNERRITQLKLAATIRPKVQQGNVSRMTKTGSFQREMRKRLNKALNRLTGLNQVWFPEKDSEDDDRK